MYTVAKKIKEGSIEALEIFFNAEYDNLIFFVNSYLKDKNAAKDIVQESFIAFWHNRDKIDETKNIRTLIFCIARNKTINVLKSKQYNVKREDINEVKAELMALQSDYVTSRIDSLSLEDLIRKTYGNLPENARRSFEMSREEGLTNKEIANALGISVRAVEYHISASLKIFRKKLKDYLPLLFVL